MPRGPLKAALARPKIFFSTVPHKNRAAIFPAPTHQFLCQLGALSDIGRVAISSLIGPSVMTDDRHCRDDRRLHGCTAASVASHFVALATLDAVHRRAIL